MAILIDTSVFIAVERGALDLSLRLANDSDEEIWLCTITASELFYGVHRATTATVRARRSALVEGVLIRHGIAEFDLSAARVHAALSADLARAGTPVGHHDLIIAATALARGWPVATADRRSFLKIPGLQVLDWGPPGPAPG